VPDYLNGNTTQRAKWFRGEKANLDNSQTLAGIQKDDEEHTG
jgi:hypothetical protein